MGGLLHLVQRRGAWRAAAPPSPLIAVPNTSPINGQSLYCYMMVRCSAVLMWQLKRLNAYLLILQYISIF